MPFSERITVTLPTDLVEQIDRLGRSRSKFITEAVEHELSRRHRDALRISLHTPHTKTVRFIDAGLSEWMPDLPGDEPLVDVSAGTPVRWIAGQGWTTE